MSEYDPWIGKTVWRTGDDGDFQLGKIWRTGYKAGPTLPGELIDVDIHWYDSGATATGVSARYLFDFCHVWEPPPTDLAALEKWLDA